MHRPRRRDPEAADEAIREHRAEIVSLGARRVGGKIDDRPSAAVGDQRGQEFTRSARGVGEAMDPDGPRRHKRGALPEQLGRTGQPRARTPDAEIGQRARRPGRRCNHRTGTAVGRTGKARFGEGLFHGIEVGRDGRVEARVEEVRDRGGHGAIAVVERVQQLAQLRLFPRRATHQDRKQRVGTAGRLPGSVQTFEGQTVERLEHEAGHGMPTPRDETRRHVLAEAGGGHHDPHRS